MTSHRCPPTCHRCPDLDGDVMPGCMGTAANQAGADTARLLTWCTCSANLTLPQEDNLAHRVALLEARLAELADQL
ncbi:hypothetical protein FH609_004245 [Streptomyces sp. 3MP-14]|uniref:Uncharacterized protein n=1 Tax=Streptomyces mimosae TaxID=2586635 RepID=A0A5N6A4L6_9ACTN|nr:MULTISPECIES: hypothetical protein [Streptomyces]KAB8162943.1 hypothetical protein FH607_020105 [Streptomyces mimosae]KAB8179157.1 hypothetical protein FH609_004245 [Streptomyces sp. 3MP-14]